MSFVELETIFKALWVSDTSGLASKSHNNLRLRIISKSVDIQTCLDTIQNRYNQEGEHLENDTETIQTKQLLIRLLCDMINLCLFWFVLHKIPFTDVYKQMMLGIVDKYYKFCKHII